MRDMHLPVLRLAGLLALSWLLALAGCARYVTPGGPADFRALGVTPQDADAMTTSGVREAFARRPAASFPASVALARVQGRGYTSYTSRGYGSGAFTIISTRDVEREADFEKLTKLPMLAGVAPLNRLVVPQEIRNEEDLRNAAAQVQADILLIYTFDTEFWTETTVPHLGTITLGLFPNERAKVTSTASSAFIDVRTGFIYGLSEVTHTSSRIANAWTSKEAVDQTRREVEAEAFSMLTKEWQKTWTGIAARFGPAGAATQNVSAPVLVPASDQ